MKISTGKGDAGQTGVGGGLRVDKDDVRVECLGEIDEFNSGIGLLRAWLGPEHRWQEDLQKVQTDMMEIMSHLATPGDMAKQNTRPHPEDGPRYLEMWSFELEKSLDEASDWFLLPGGNVASSQCHLVRTAVRRAERRLISLKKADPDCVLPYMLVYVNRLSDTLFLMARVLMQDEGVSEEKWKLFKPPAE
ncbi:cob(I)yrinic acid a,c-diamide adenosyltransferase [Salinispira pacifica]|uniref:Corrinoid adenosyltransferase n=1 Tax=Salinispira pacifica TaxID=1307761 RepID=V5WHX7_9SPIO|nr:cob(I)yrinic acid a,c-diamide adenosyltransferase [Salinispira pacifica]AHC15432.1 Cob(I)alamin adenosyltransferase PduO [Salinispira pacifica]